VKPAQSESMTKINQEQAKAWSEYLTALHKREDMKDRTEKINELKHFYQRTTQVGRALLWLLLVSVIPVIWFPWLWKIPATFAYLDFACLLFAVSAGYKIKQIESGEE
jgi:uncharacterized membrane protein (DUF106 family)